MYKHHVHCEHKKLKFCLRCDKPYCEDCGEEWNQYRYSWVYGQYTAQATGLNPSHTGTAFATINTTETSCSHDGGN